MRATYVFLKYIKAFPYYIYGILVTIFNFIQPIESHINENDSSDIIEFIKNFEQRYGKTRPDFCTCDYVTCVNKAKSSLSYLLIYLHGDDHEDSDYFCRNTLCNPVLLEYLNRPDLLFWACNINSSDGFSVSKIIREHCYPFIGLVAINANSRMYLVERSEGLLTAEQLMAFIGNAMASNSIGIEMCRAERDKKTNHRLLRQEQEHEYAECLRKDQERDRLELENIKKRLILKQNLDREQEEQRHTMALWRTRQTQVSSILPCQPADLGESNQVTVKVKFPSGVWIQRRFLLADSTKLLFYFIFCSSDCPRNFTVFSNFPKREILCRPVHLEWDNQFISRLPRSDFDDPKSFCDSGMIVNTMFYVLDNDA